jgi:hypothetical protein
MASSDNSINASLSLAKLYKRIRTINPAHKPGSLYQARLKSRQAACRMRSGVVR